MHRFTGFPASRYLRTSYLESSMTLAAWDIRKEYNKKLYLTAVQVIKQFSE